MEDDETTFEFSVRITVRTGDRSEEGLRDSLVDILDQQIAGAVIVDVLRGEEV